MPQRRIAVVGGGGAALRFVRAAREAARGGGASIEIVAVRPDSAALVRAADLVASHASASIDALLKETAAGEAWCGSASAHERAEVADACATLGIRYLGETVPAWRDLAGGAARIPAESNGAGTTDVHVVSDGSGAAQVAGICDLTVADGRVAVAESSRLPVERQRLLSEVALRVCAATRFRGAGAVRFTAAGVPCAFDPLPPGEPAVEAATGIDLMRIRLAVARGEPVGLAPPRGCAATALVRAQGGTVRILRIPGGAGIRADAAAIEGDPVPQDGLLAAVTASGADRGEVVARLAEALAETRILVRGSATSKAVLLGWCGADARRPDARDLAVLAAAIEEADEDADAETARFFEEARRGRPQLDGRIPRAIDLLCGGMRFRVVVRRIGEHEVRVSSGAFRADVLVELPGPCERRLSFGATRVRVFIARDARGSDVEVDGASFAVVRDRGGAVASPMPAVVTRLLVGRGDLVREGQTIAVLEAMKMEAPIAAPAAGRVTAVFVQPNSHVDPGDPLVAIDADVEARPEEARSLELTSGPDPDANAELRRLLLGFDLDASERERLASSTPGEDAEVWALSAFADVQSLRGGGRRAEEEFLRYLRAPELSAEQLSPAFQAAIDRALALYGVMGREAGRELRSALARMWNAQQLADEHVGLVLRVLERRLQRRDVAPEGWRTTLERLATVAEGRFPALADLAREARFRWYDQPLLDRVRHAAWEQAEQDVHALAAGDGASGAMRRLVDSPQPLAGLLLASMAEAAPAVRPPLVETLLRRYYRLRELHDVASFTLEGIACARAEYERDGRRLRLAAAFASASRVDAALAALARLLSDAPRDLELAVDVYLWDDQPPRSDEAAGAALLSALESAGFTRPLRRAAFALTGPGRGRGNSGQQHFTFRSVESRYAEDMLCRGIHPMLAKRMRLYRLSKFDLERVPSAEDVHLYRGIAKGNPKDERLFAVAEVRDLTPERGPDGRIVRLPYLERMLHEALAGMRVFQAHRAPEERLEWNRVLLSVGPPLTLSREDLRELVERISPAAEGLGLEMVILAGRAPHPATGELRDTLVRILSPDRHGIRIHWDGPSDRPLEPLGEYQQKVVQLRRRGLTHPYEIARMLAPVAETASSEIPAGEFVEHDLDASGVLVPVDRPPGKNTAHLVAGVVRNFVPRYPEGMIRVVLLGDASREMGSVAEPECRRIVAALDLAEKLGVPLDWFTLSAGAKISMSSGTENMDWVSRALRRIVQFTQRGGEINVVVCGINVGAQPYWNAEATMLMHTRGILVMVPGSAMVLTGKQALEYSGSVSAEDNEGIGGYDRIMGTNGQAQYRAASIGDACRLLVRHHEHCYVAPGERFPRRAATSDPRDRDVQLSPHGGHFATVGDVFSSEANPDRKKPFEIRRILRAAIDADHEPIERWPDWRGGETAVVWDAHLGGWPVCLVGIESQPVARRGWVPADGPEQWTAGTLFPQSSKKIARALNSASGRRPVVVLANLSGFDGSPESMRRLQLEYGAEIGRAVVNFDGPIVFTVVSRYHGGAFVVFSRALRENMEVSAVEGARASVIGGAPAAAVVFAREVEQRARKDARVVEALRAGPSAKYLDVLAAVRAEKLGGVADEFDRVHSVERAQKVGSLDTILAPARLRPYLIEAIERGIARSAR